MTSTNSLVDVVDFFGQNVYADLAAAPGSVHPILVVDAIKFLYTFRNQVSPSLYRSLALIRLEWCTGSYGIGVLHDEGLC